MANGIALLACAASLYIFSLVYLVARTLTVSNWLGLVESNNLLASAVSP